MFLLLLKELIIIFVFKGVVAGGWFVENRFRPFPLLLKELIIIFLFVITAAGVVPCEIPKKRLRTLSLVQFIFYIWSFEISRNILRNQKTL